MRLSADTYVLGKGAKRVFRAIVDGQPETVERPPARQAVPKEAWIYSQCALS